MSAAIKRKALKRALIFSFAVYLIPIMFPHMVLITGYILYKEFASGFAKKEVLWVVTDVALFLSAQGICFLSLFWYFIKPSVIRTIPISAAMILLIYFVNVFYSLIIPTMFLIESDTRVEQGEWNVVCEVDNLYLRPLPFRYAYNEGQREIWAVRSSTNQLVSLQLSGDLIGELPGCSVKEFEPSPGKINPQIISVSMNGSILYKTLNNKREYELRHLQSPDSEPKMIPEPRDTIGIPVLSTNGLWVGWMVVVRDERRFVKDKFVMLTNTEKDETVTIPLSRLGLGSYELFGFDMDERAITLSKSLRDFITIDLDGSIISEILHPGELAVQPTSFKTAGGGWVAWDAYKDRGEYAVAWSLSKGQGLYTIPKGRSVSDLAVSYDGRFIAVSLNTTLNIGNIKDSVFVIRVSDGEEVFRRYLPTYTRTGVAFVGNMFVYTVLDESGSRVVVVEAPD